MIKKKKTETLKAPKITKIIDNNGQKIYIGPTIKNILIKNSIFYGEPGEDVAKILKEFPLAKNLFIPIEHFSNALTQLGKKGTSINYFYSTIVKKVSEQ